MVINRLALKGKRGWGKKKQRWEEEESSTIEQEE
jgi:hypothetical protein